MKTMKTKRRKRSKNSTCKSNKGRTNGIAVLNNDTIKGTVYFKHTLNGLRVDYNIKGLTDGEHGFHIHEYGDLTDGCTSACKHFNPYNKQHGGLNDANSHAGDLGNILSSNNVAKGHLYSKKISITPGKKNNIIGRMIIVHEDRDDLGKGNNAESLKTGNAGKRIACGVIGITNKIEY